MSAVCSDRAFGQSTYEAIIDVIKREGFLGLYSGLNSSLLGIAITNGYVTVVVCRQLTFRTVSTRVYYYFYERSRGVILSSRAGGKGLSTAESMLAGLIAGSSTTIISNPIWVIQTSQAIQSMSQSSSAEPGSPKPKRMGIIQTIKYILRKGGIGAFWRGIGPALVLVVNPMLQYTVFEQLKNILVRRRTARLRAAGLAGAAAIAVLSDWDYFLLGAISKLGEPDGCYRCTHWLIRDSVATSTTYPYM